MNLIPSMPEGAKSKTGVMVLTGLAGFVVIGLLAPFIFMALGGLIGFIAAAAVGLVSLRMAPWFSMKVSNFGLKLLKGEAYNNPVPTRENLSIEKKKELMDAANHIKEFNEEVEKYAGQVQALQRQYPAEAKRYQDLLENQKTILQRKYDALKIANQKLLEFDLMTEKVRTLWDMGQGTKKLMKLSGSMGKMTPLQEILASETLRAADDSVSESFAALNHIINTEEDSTALLHSQTQQAQLTNQPADNLLQPISGNVYAAPDRMERKSS